jgi:hypothetical protein
MKKLPILAAITLAASCTGALAGGDTTAKPGTRLDADKNPSALHNPTAGNPAGTKWVRHGQQATILPKGMKTSHVSATPRHHARHIAPAANTAK